MQEISVKLFKGAYTLKPKAEEPLMLLAFAAVAVQLGFLVHLAISEMYTVDLVLVFLVNLLIPSYFFFNIWLDGKPKYRRHLTLTDEGVCYRSKFMHKEQEFDWEEVDTVQIEMYRVKFLLKNEEEHAINLERIQNEEILQLVKDQIREMVQRKEIMLQ